MIPPSSPSDHPGIRLDETTTPPPVVPDHELIRCVGRGSYGEVWLARNVMGTFRAVKIVHRSSFRDDHPFEREYAGLKRFEPVSRSHDSQVDILHMGRLDDCFYYVMELADDEANGSKIDPATYRPHTLRSAHEGHIHYTAEETLEIGLALTTALEHLHKHGLVHRDIKPSNVIFVNGIPKLADIGLVSSVDATRSYVGTEGFVPPEGPGAPTGDLYSLGKVLYELCTGRDRKDYPELPTSLAESPDRERLLELNAVIAKACRESSKDRYQSATAMKQDLLLMQSGKSVRRMQKLEQRLLQVRRLGIAALVAISITLAAFFFQQHQTREARRLARENNALAEETARLGEENRARLVRLDIANGVRLIDKDDYSGALLWFAEALPLLANNPAEEQVHRIRIQQLLSHSPLLLRVFPHDANTITGALSPDGRRVATGTAKGDLTIWDADSGATVIGPLHLGNRIMDLRFTKDGTLLLARSSADRGAASLRPETDGQGFAAVLNAESAQPVFATVSNAVTTAFSPDDRLLAVARTNFVIEVVDVMNGRPVVRLSGHTNNITMLAFSADGSLLASASEDQTARLWRLPSGEPVGGPLRHAQAVYRVVLSSDARRLATATGAPGFGSRNGSKWCSIHTWDVATGMEIGSAIQAANPIFALDFLPDDHRRLITGDNNFWINVLDADSHKAVLPRLDYWSTARCWAFSPDGLRLAAGSDDGTARVWDLETGELLTPILRHAGWVESVSFSPDGSRLLTTSDDATAKIWELTTLPEAAKPLQLGWAINYRPANVASVQPAFSSDGRRLLLSPVDRTLRLVNLETLRQDGTPMPAPDDDIAGAITFDASGRQWAAALGNYIGDGRSRSAGLWREEAGGLRHFELPHPNAVGFVQFTGDGSRLVTWSHDARVRTWRTTDGKLLGEQRIPDIYARMIALSTDGARAVMVRTNDSAPDLLDLSKSVAAGVPLIGAGSTMSAAFSPEGDRVATAGTSQSGQIWDTRTGQALTPPFKHGGSLNWIEWSPDGRQVLTAELANNVIVWDAATGEGGTESMRLAQGALRVAHFSPDGRFLVGRSDNQFVRVWDRATAGPVTAPLKHAGGVVAAMVTSDNRLVTVSEPGVVRAWDLVPTQLPAGVIADFARLLAGNILDRAGDWRPLKPTEIAELSQTLRATQPALFAADRQQLREWHHRQVKELTTLARVKAASFHLDRLAELDPSDSEVKEQQAKVAATRIPRRDPSTPANLIDLSEAYTHSFGMHPYQDFVDLPTGLQTLAGTRFDLRGFVRLENTDSEDTVSGGSLHMPGVRNIRVGKRCQELHFLQSAETGYLGKDGDEVARWVIHYVDGSVREWPVVYGEHLRNSWYAETWEPKPASVAVVAWEGHPPAATKSGAESVRLFKSTWTNPLPKIEVASLDFVVGKVDVQPFVVAITAE